MITLEISPDVLEPAAPPTLDLSTDTHAEEGEMTRVQRSATGEILGWATQKQNPRHMVRFFQGKGGFCVVVSDDEIVYFGLPGCRIDLPDTHVELPGQSIQGKPQSNIVPLSQTETQAVTPQAMILGAGLATRFEPVSGDTTGYPKPGVPLAGEDSVIGVIAKHLRHHGFNRILINTFYKPDCLKKQLLDLQNLEIVYIDEDAPSGTAGGLAKALEQGLVDRTKPIFIIQGDAITDADLSYLMRIHEERGAAVTIGGQIVSDEDVHKFGIIETDAAGGDEQSGNITSFKEKPSLEQAGRSRFANSGFYILSPEVYDLFLEGWRKSQANNKIYDYAQDFFPLVLQAVQQGKILNAKTGQPMPFWAQAVGGYWNDIGNPTQYLEAVRDVYTAKVRVDLPEDVTHYYDRGVMFWPGAKSIAEAQQARLFGNVIVARSFC